MKQKFKMLCVDDKEELRKSLHQQFSNEDFIVDTAESGPKALEKIKANDYDIVLLDLKMPNNMEGMEVLKEMKNIGKLTNVIMLTGVDDVNIALECVKIGARDFVSKPYDPEELLLIVNRVLGA
ncbi:MAG TPA: response regulator [Bacteroidota bacterium]|nr:response regulator [Bacteroidota bacterium]